MKIKKIYQSVGVVAEVEQNLNSNSEVNVPSVKAVKNAIEMNIPSNGESIKCGYKRDGKDVYCKIISFATPNNESKSYATGLTSYDKVWIDESNSFIDGSFETMSINTYGTDGYTRCWYNKQNNVIRFVTSWNLEGRTAYVCVKYTLAD